MKVLLFEYICGGGLADQPLPASLAKEGGMMLQALVEELKLLPEIEPVILLDRRCSLNDLPARGRLVYIEERGDYLPVLEQCLSESDLFWPIAPETAGILNSLAELSQAHGVKCLLSTPSALRLCASKYQTSCYLNQHNIKAVETKYLDGVSDVLSGKMVIKADDGVGCEESYIISSGRADVLRLAGRKYVKQPLLSGRSLSLSCLCKDGAGWLLCCNEQELSFDNSRFHLTACRVNVGDRPADYYQSLVDRVAAAIPGLWGYIGIDLIESEQEGTVILEINPRLTTSYCGIYAATGINVAEQVFRLLDSEPAYHNDRNQTITVDIH